MTMIFQETPRQEQKTATATMRALVFRGPHQIGIERVRIPKAGPGEAVIRVTLTTICGTDLHILRGEYAVKPGLIIGHEPVGIIHELGVGVMGYKIGERVLAGAITPCGQCNYCLGGDWSQCGGAIGGWKFGNTINGAQAEYLLVPNAQANLAKIPDDLCDEQVVLLADIASTGISAAESADLQIGDTVAIFAQGPIGLCATAGARLKGAGLIIAVESDAVRAQMAKRMGADYILNFKETDVISEIKRLTDGKGVDVAIEAVGVPASFDICQNIVRPGGHVAVIGVHGHSVDLQLQKLWIQNIVLTTGLVSTNTTPMLLKNVSSGKLEPKKLITHHFRLDDILEAYNVFTNAAEKNALKVIIESEGAGMLKTGVEEKKEELAGRA